MDFLNEYMVVAILGVCLCVGYVIKNLIPSETVDRFIPLIMGALGTALNIWMSGGVSVEVILGGLVSGLASTGLYEAFYQFVRK